MSKIVNLINSAVAFVAAEDSAAESPEAVAGPVASSTAVHYYLPEADFAVADQTAAPQLPALLLSAAQDCGIPEA